MALSATNVTEHSKMLQISVTIQVPRQTWLYWSGWLKKMQGQQMW